MQTLQGFVEEHAGSTPADATVKHSLSVKGEEAEQLSPDRVSVVGTA